jgi:hypothetical protein
MRPNFLVIGAMKCATTTLCEHLGRHPQVFMASPKEPHFFNNDDVFGRGWPWYEALFSGAEGKLAIGEGNTANTMKAIFPNASQRIAAHLPQAKLIYIVRNPLKRIESHWMAVLTRGGDPPSFPAFLRDWPSAVDTSRYWRQISAYREHFADKQILVLFFEDFVQDPSRVLNRCFEFLGVDPSLGQIDSKLVMNASTGYGVDGPLIRFVRKLPGVESLKVAAPVISRAVGAKLRRPMPGRPIWTTDLRRQVVDQLADDSATLLRHYGKPADWWQFDEVAENP